ncbi:MAG: hypothetical protein QOE36_874 [Gaiellaceae bacterium]|nr:hypothetical protein [Gaiellaceae bacterium]
MTDSAEVVVVGGGAVGASTAYHLTQLGITDVVLLERDTLAAGSTSKSAGGIRAQFADELNVRIALRAIDKFERFEDELGVDIDHRQWGYLFLLEDPDDVAAFRAALELQQRLGVPSRELTVDEALELIPQLSPEGLLAATFCPLDGQATPESVVQGYAAAASRAGARVRQGTAVERIVVEDGRIARVDTSAGPIACGTVVCAAGAWSGELAAMAGFDLPVRGERRHVFFSPQDGGLPRELPLTTDFSTRFYFHREGPGIAFAAGRGETLEEVGPAAMRRLPLIEDLPIQSSWWGYYEMSPDHNALVGEADEPSRFLYATGFSGHGFQQAPVVGEHLAELVAGREPTLDLSAFDAGRFARGEAREEQFVV